MAIFGNSKFLITIFPKKMGKKFRMAKNSHSKFFQAIFSKKSDSNLEWPQIAISNFFGQFFPLVQIWNGQK